MQPITARSTGLHWSQPSALHMHFELRAGTDLVASLRFRSMFGTLATAESGDGSWTLKRVGFLHGRVTVRTAGAETDLAEFRNDTWSSGGELVFASGRRFKVTTGAWRTRLDIATEAESVLVSFHYEGVFHRAADVTIVPAASELPELPLLVLVGWYLLVLLHREQT